MCRKFVRPTKHPPIAWDTLCKPLEDGELGLKNLRAWNKALLAKTLWKIHINTDSMWIRWVNHIYSGVGDVWNWNWNWHREQSSLIKQILSIRDELILKFQSVENAMACLQLWFNGNAGLSKAYDFFVHKKGKWPWKPLLASREILPKQRFALWLLTHGKLMTWDRLSFVEDKKCVLCNVMDESVHHLFFNCDTSKRIWKGVRDWLGMKKKMESATSVLIAFRTEYGGKFRLSRMRSAALAAAVYHIWNLRNRVMFENEKVHVEDIIMKIQIQIFRCFPSTTDIFSRVM